MAQTMQAYIANALEMRKQNAAAAQFRAQMQQAQYDRMSSAIASAGKGLGQVFGGGMSSQDKLANRLMQEQYTIPGAARAQAVNPAMQGPADALRNQMYMGGMDELKMRQGMEDQTAQRAVEGSQIDARIARLNLAQVGATRADAELGLKVDALELRRQALEQAEQARIAKAALDATKRVDEDYTKQFYRADAYNKRMTSHLKQISTAKDPTQWQAGVDAMNAEYQAGIKTGLKVTEPTVRPFLDEEQKAAIAMEEQRLKAMPRHSGVLEDQTPDWMQWPRPQQERSALAAEEKIKGMPGYEETRPGYSPPPQPEGIFAAIPPPPDPNTPSPSAPAQAAGGAAGPQPISADEAFKMTGKQLPPGKRFDSGPGTQVYVVK